MSSINSINSTNTSSTEIINAIKEAARAARAGTEKPARGYQRRGDKFLAQIGIGSAKVYLGTFDTAEAATAAYNRAKEQLEQLRAVTPE